MPAGTAFCELSTETDEETGGDGCDPWGFEVLREVGGEEELDGQGRGEESD